MNYMSLLSLVCMINLQMKSKTFASGPFGPPKTGLFQFFLCVSIVLGEPPVSFFWAIFTMPTPND